ncbi:phosphatase PAP2 family protein [Neolewinella antarctica]|uniref:Membrane-associated phospholipid phosphatase n=1 Tax=Neolewinella antarctica TaxID=442734 RepID=A0ABX0XAJ1_9BACT|nr:phosphatase PAP2 family protein [Neolewinella antarctica]NJC26075.1 membrane-associated phospholipid phosphatase [Neolewinella antarctica]
MRPTYGLLLSFVFFSCLISTMQAQSIPLAERKDIRAYNPTEEKVYAINPWIDGGIGLGGMIISTTLIDKLRDKDVVDFASLDRDDVAGFDRWAFPDNADRREDAESASDVFFNASILLPFTLFLDKKIRKDWIDITALYVQTHALSSLTYAITPLGPTFIDRARPVAYYEDVDDSIRELGNNRNSFFSGHVSTTAVGTFFFAKVLSDYNPQWNGKQRALAFGLASLPPAYVAIKRIQALKHFPSDTVVGFGVGAFFGIMTPHIHKRWQRKHRSKLSIGGSYGDGAGVAGLGLTF